MAANGVTVAVWNQALLHLGQPLLAGPDDDTTTAALVRVSWDIVRPAVLRSYAWNCALRRALLPPLADPPAWGYARAFPFPTGCLRLWEVNGQRDRAWSVEGGQILTDMPGPLRVRYIADIEAHEMDPELRRLVALEMASDLAVAITNNAGAAERLAQMLVRARVEIRASDAREGNEHQTYDTDALSDWVQVR